MSAEQDIKLLCETILHFDKKGLKAFNISREDLYKKWTGEFIDAMKKSANNIFTGKQSKQMADALINALKKVSIDTQATDDESKVQVTVNGLDFEKDFSNKNTRLDVDFGATQEEIAASVARAVAKKFNSMKVAKTMVFVVDCEHHEEGDVWMPINMQAFFDTLSASAMGNPQQ